MLHAVLGVMFVSLAIHMRVQPYMEPVLDRLETLSMAGSVLTLWLGLFFYLGTPVEVEIVLTIVLVLFNALLCLEFAMSIVTEMARTQLVRRMPVGLQEGGVSEDALSDHLVYTLWCGALSCALLWAMLASHSSFAARTGPAWPTCQQGLARKCMRGWSCSSSAGWSTAGAPCSRSAMRSRRQ